MGKPKCIPLPTPVFLWADSGFISWQPSHNSSLLACLCCTFILFAVTFPRPSHLSTWKTLMRLQHDIKASPSPNTLSGCFDLWLLFFSPSYNMKDHQCFPHVRMCTDTHGHALPHGDAHMHVCAHTFSLSQPHSHVQTEWSVNQIKHPQCFRENECALDNGEMKRGKKEKERRREGVDMGDCTSSWK